QRVPRADEPLERLIERGLRAFAVADVDEHAVLAVRLGIDERLLGDRQDAGSALAGGLRHELLEPQPEARQRARYDERELVASGARHRADRGSELHAGGELGAELLGRLRSASR